LADQTDTQTMTLAWGPDGVAEVDSVDELDTLLARLTREAELTDPFVVELVAGEHGTLAMGVGRPETVLSHTPASGDPPYHASRGDPSAEGFIDFYFQGSYSEYPREQAVPVEVGREAMRRYFDRPDRLPDNVEWQEV
jgi:Immunity protein Imm1